MSKRSPATLRQNRRFPANVSSPTGSSRRFRTEIVDLGRDADIICNWLGAHASVPAMDWYGHDRLVKTPFTIMTMNGKAVAEMLNVDFSFAPVYQAGHQVPAFQPETSFDSDKSCIKSNLTRFEFLRPFFCDNFLVDMFRC